LRAFLRDRAANGGTVLVSSHALAEVQQTVDDVVIIRSGRLVHAGPLAEVAAHRTVVVRSPDIQQLSPLLAGRPGAAVTDRGDGSLEVAGMSAEEIGALAFSARVELHELAPQSDALERAFLDLTGGAS
jgi:ABC-2 type transport system ATP-binding protein